ncbi:aminotransferase class IV [uncultured Lutibacter sp.]|uniref:aminotransferase class IV n=1 Tax=Lutibacter sp. TaxID=1925666 RepID=UPI002628009E|nr:aminotransferase class IV [uncultured Lutibacter sp.]
MINFNGSFLEKSTTFFNAENRAFKYGDALFETIKVFNSRVVFLEDHYFRLMASMRMLRMEIPMSFTLDFFESEILKTVRENKLTNARVRITVYRGNGGLYTPINNSVQYLVEASMLQVEKKASYTVDLFKDYYCYSGLLSTIKTTNKLTNILASIYASENNLNNCILLNERKFVAEAINGNIFIVVDNKIKTPPITEGCVKGIVRKKLIDILSKNPNYNLEETPISPFELQKANEVFITNTIIGIQSVTKYKKSNYKTEVADELKEELEVLI